MTAVQYVEAILKDRWQTSVSGRTNDLPDIGGLGSSAGVRVAQESARNLRRANPDQYDVLFVRDGGVTDVQPQSFGWDEERQLSRVTVDIRTTGQAGSTDGRLRLWGERDGSNDAPTYGGLTGEVKRICEEVRRGHKEFDLIKVAEMNDLSGEMGGQVWRATITVELDIRATTLNP